MATIKKLEKASDEELKAAGAEVTKLAPADDAEVEGQDPYIGRVECPWCGMTSRVILDTDYYKYFACGNCGRPAKGRHGA